MTIPPSRCGFELTQKIFTQRGVSDEARRQEILKLDVEDWHRKYNVSSCWRPIWKDSDQCIWHANLEPKSNEDLVSAYSSEEITIDSNFHWRPGDPKSFYFPVIDGTNISGVYLSFITGPVRMQGSFLGAVNLHSAAMFGANLQGSKILATDLTGSDLSETNLQDTSFEITDLTDANLSDANLRRAQFEFLDISNANLKGVDLENSTFCEVNLSDSDLRSASLKGSHITETIIENIRLNQGAQIFPVNLAGIESADEYDKLARTTHDLGKAAKKNGLLRKARNLRIQERKARQSEAYENRDFRTYLGSLISEWVIGYGIGIWRISLVILFVIIGSAAMYLIFGVSEGETLVDAMLNALEYSIMTFTGVGNSDSLPSNPFMRILVFAQSFAGVLFSVLLGYILGTREQP